MCTSPLGKLLATGAALVAIPLGAQAADLRMRTGPMPSPAFSWTGLYGGGNSGCGWHSTPDPRNFGTDPTETDIIGFNKETATGCFTGFQLGYNYQTGVWVWGVEADVQFGKISSFNQSVAVNDLVGAGTPELESSWESKITSFGTVRGKLGYAIDGPLPWVGGGVSWMPYFTVGYAWARNKLSFHSEDGLVSSDTQTLGGYAIGGGFAYALTQKVTWTAEYLHLGFDSKTYNVFVDQDTGVPAGASYGRLNVNLYRTGLNWRF